MKNFIGYLLTGIRLRLLLQLFRRNKISFYPLYLVRFFLLLQNACWSSFFARKDKKWEKEINSHPLPRDPIIIIGHWRTGSTYLHQLLNLHDDLAAPTLFQTSQPEGFIKAKKYYAPVMKKILGKKRPFDQMKIGIDEAQEDEFALFRLTGFSPLELLIFPRSGDYFLLHPECRFIPEGDTFQYWEEKIKYFYRKISWANQKRLLLKNPFHSMRIAYLKTLFPEARFIHIYRNPYDVVASSVKMWSVVGRHNAMNTRWQPPGYVEVTEFYARLQNEIYAQLNQADGIKSIEVKFENLEKEPVSEIKRICEALGIGFSENYKNRILKYLQSNQGYAKSRHHLHETEKMMIFEKMKEYIQRYGY